MCDESITGDGPDKLSMNLKEHLIYQHQMKVIDEVARFNKEPPGGGSPRSKQVIDEVARFNREPSGGGSPGSMKEIDEVARFNREPSGGGSQESMKVIDEVARFNAERAGGSSPKSMKVIEVVSPFQSEPVLGKSIASETCKGPTAGKVRVNCPICGCPMYAGNDDDLSGVLRGHMTEDHRS